MGWSWAPAPRPSGAWRRSDIASIALASPEPPAAWAVPRHALPPPPRAGLVIGTIPPLDGVPTPATVRFVVAADFSPVVGGRYRREGLFSGERLCQRLSPLLDAGGKVVVELDGVDGYSWEFLEEAFGGLVRLGMAPNALRRKLRLVSEDASLIEEVWRYIGRARTLSTPL